MKNDWSGIDGGDLLLIYNSLHPSEAAGTTEPEGVSVWLNAPTWARWNVFTEEIGEELDRRWAEWEREHTDTVGTPPAGA